MGNKMSEEPVRDTDFVFLPESDETDEAADAVCGSDGQLYSLTVPENYDGMRTDRFLAQALPEMSRSRLQELVKDGMAVIDGKPVKSSRKLSAGETISIRVPYPKVPEIIPENIPLDILYEDNDILIVNKSKNMTVHPAPGHTTGTLVNAVLFHCRENLSGINGVLRPGIVHRIDKNTTGALIICKNDQTHRKIAEQLAVHSISRKYLGLVCGNLREDNGTIEGNIGRDPKDRKKMAVVKNGGKPAVTHYTVLERFGNYTLCEFRLETGRTHQIRVHMASKGHPLLGDDIYSSGRSPYAVQGQTLHAALIGFIHPRTGEYVEFAAPLPDYFENILRKLRAGK